MVKPRMHSWIDEYSDESGIDYNAYLTITMPDQQQDIDFEATFSSRLEAEKWCSELESLLEGCMVSIKG